MADEKLVLHLESLETIPKNGISFKDDAGRERRFAILQSGKEAVFICRRLIKAQCLMIA